MDRCAAFYSVNPSIELVPMPRDAFPGYDDPVNIDADPEEALNVLLGDEVGEGESETVEPVTDE